MAAILTTITTGNQTESITVSEKMVSDLHDDATHEQVVEWAQKVIKQAFHNEVIRNLREDLVVDYSAEHIKEGS